MRMKQYLQCIDYTLWKIVENGNAPIVTKTVDGEETVIPPKIVEEKAQRRAELKARSTLIDQDAEVTLVNETQGRYDDAQMFDTYVFNGEEVFVAEQSEKVVKEVVSTTEVSNAATYTTEEITLAQALAELRSVKPKVVVQEPVQSTTTTTPLAIPRAKGIVFHEQEQAPTPIVSSRQPTQNKLDIAREKAEKVEEANISWDNVQAMIEADSQLKNKLFEEIQKLFDKAMTRVNMFVDIDTELVKESSKKVKEEMAQEKEDVAIDDIPLATKSTSIVGFWIHRKGRNGYYEIIRADGSAKTYLLFSQLLKEFDKEDLENLWKLVKAKHRNTRPEEGYERVLWGDLKTMFEHHIEDLIWRNLQGKKVLLWGLYDSCRVHFVRFEDMHVYMLVEKRYPLTPATITGMLNKKLKSDYWNDMYYQLLKIMTK
ncbi:hypothetical protein Tco_0138332 [Tanacetum coccineum]